ncbi:MAG: SCO family protein [Leptospiraceae bacterium]|nr:SCO family protein [Leptospiraceae bacterium]
MKNFRRLVILAMLALTGASFSTLLAEKTRTPEGVGVDQKLSAQIPLDTEFYNEKGEKVKLDSFFQSGRMPVILAPSYFECPRLCTLVFNGLSKAMNQMGKSGLKPGKDYRAISLSFNPEDTPKLAREKGDRYRSTIKSQKVTEEGWEFLTGDRESIHAVLDSVGYSYKKDTEGSFSHPAAIILITPEGKVSSYLFGFDYNPTDMRLALVEASSGKIGSLTDAVLLTCFRFDPQKGKYTTDVMNVMKIMALVVIAFLVGLVIFLYRKERNT